MRVADGVKVLISWSYNKISLGYLDVPNIIIRVLK